MPSPLGSVFVEILGDADPFAEDFAEALDTAGAVASESLTGSMADAGAEIESELADVGDAAGGALVEGLEESVSGLDPDVSGAFDPVVTEATEAADDTAGVFESVVGRIQEAFDDIDLSALSETVEDNLLGITAAGVAAGASAEGFARAQQDTNATLARAAIVSGETEAALRDSIVAMTDHTFSAHDAAAGMDELIRRGVTTREGFEAILPVMDDFADATGKDLVDSIQLFDQTLGALGIPLEEAGGQVDAFTFLTTQTDVALGTLQRNLPRVAGELQTLGFDAFDAAAGIEVFRDRGLDGREAVREFRRAVADSEGDMDALLENLGLTAEEFDEYRENVDAASEGLTGQFAEANNAVMTPMQRVQASLGNLMFRFGGVADAAGMVAAPLAGLGPVAFGVTQGKAALASILPKLGAALGAVGKSFLALGKIILANPIFLIAAVIVGLIAVAWHFRDEIMEALGAAWDWIRDTVTALWDWLGDVWEAGKEAVVGFVRDLVVGVVRWWLDLDARVRAAVRDLVVGVIRGFLDLDARVRAAVRDLVERTVAFAVDLGVRFVAAVRDLVSRAVGFARELPGRVLAAVRDLAGSVLRFINQYHPVAILMRAMRAAWPAVWAWIRERPSVIVNVWRTMIDRVRGVGRDLIVGLWNGIRSMGTWLRDRIVGFVRDRIPGPIARALGLSSPSTLMAGFGRDIVRGLALGIDAEADVAAEAVESLAAHIAGVDLPALGVDPVDLPDGPRGGDGAAMLEQGRGQPNIEITVNNPVPEPASTSVSRQVRRLAAMGVFDS